MNFKFKSVLLFLKLCIKLISLRPFGNVIHDIGGRYDNVEIQELRKFEKLKIKINKADLDLQFLNNCQTFNVYPKFITFKSHLADKEDTRFIRKSLLKSAIIKRNKEKCKLERELGCVISKLKDKVSRLDFYILLKTVNRNVAKSEHTFIETHTKKLESLTGNSMLPFTQDEIIKNFSSYELAECEADILKFGLNYSLPPVNVRKTDVFATFELMHRAMKEDLKTKGCSGALKSEMSFLANKYSSNYKPSKTTLKKHGILKKLRKNENIVITRPDKGSGVVILNRNEYDIMIYDIINDNTKFQELTTDPTMKREGQLQRFLLKLKKEGHFKIDEYKRIYPTGSNVARIYGLPKTHKLKTDNDKLTLRPIISSIGTYNYHLSDYLSKKLSPHIPRDFTTNDTFSFVKDLSSINPEGKFMISYDVKSLFTNIPLDETLNIAVNLLKEKEPSFKKISKRNLKKLFVFATSESHFSFKNRIYDQIDGVAMGSPLGPVLANLFMGFHEGNWIDNYKGVKPIFYRRFVDDIFCLFENGSEAIEFLDHLNKQHQNIQFTDEKEKLDKLPFLDVQIDKNNKNKFLTSVYRKPTFTGLLTNFTSFVPLSYKLALIKTLVHRIFSICNTWEIFSKNIEELENFLGRNCFPPKVIGKVISKYLDSKMAPNKQNKSVDESNINYYKLPYIGKFSKECQHSISEICNKYCKNLKIRLSFSLLKTGSFFTAKDRIPVDQRSFVVYLYSCTSCNARYVGETTRKLMVRVNEHLNVGKGSVIFDHLKSNQQCKEACDKTSFKIVDQARTQFVLRLKESMHIELEKPTLNKQLYHINLSLTI